MPFVSLKTPIGEVEMCYAIATPSSDSTDAIIVGLPCILFVHAEWNCKETFEAQFSDPHLRQRYNMIALDLRASGNTVGPVKQGVYTIEAAAEDVFYFMKALNLPPVHLFGVSIGTYICLQLAIHHPDLVLSTTLCSHPPPNEPEESMEGRYQFFEFLSASFKMDGQPVSSNNVDPEYMSELVIGGLQFLFSSIDNRLTTPIINKLVLYAIQNWGSSPEHLAQARVIALDWITDKKDIDEESLAKFKAPVSIIHSTGDVAYGTQGHSLEELCARLRNAGPKEVNLHQIEGSHLAMVTHPSEVNEILFKTVTSAIQGVSYASVEDAMPQSDRPPYPTPFTEDLAQYGYDTDSGAAFELMYPSTEYGIKTLVEDHFPV